MKKEYKTPQMYVVRLNATDVIRTSPGDTDVPGPWNDPTRLDPAGTVDPTV